MKTWTLTEKSIDFKDGDGRNNHVLSVPVCYWYITQSISISFVNMYLLYLTL